nr:MAG TPA: hypothetical protein [Caudoviricetes sp.]
MYYSPTLFINLSKDVNYEKLKMKNLTPCKTNYQL